MTTYRTSISRFRPVSRRLVWTIVAVLGLLPFATAAQDAGSAETARPVPFVTVDQERLFLKSQYGQRVQRELEADRTSLAAENRKIEADLVAEELELTERREKLSSSDFSALARTFDTRVKRIRDEQDAKSSALQQKLEQERKAFLKKLGPVLADLMSSMGALALVDRNAILLAADEIDITDEAIAAMNDAIGAGDPDPPAAGSAERPPSRAPAAAE